MFGVWGGELSCCVVSVGGNELPSGVVCVCDNELSFCVVYVLGVIHVGVGRDYCDLVSWWRRF